MNIFLLGATGLTGQEILKKLIAMGHNVTVLIRNQAKLAVFSENENIVFVKGDVYQPNTYIEELTKCEFVISALGEGLSMKKTDVYSKGGQNIVSSMRKARIKRLITITSASNDPSDPASKGIMMRFIRFLFRNTFNDMLKWEKFLDQNKDIEWTCIRPCNLTTKEEQKNYRVQLDNCPKNGSTISRKDLADFIVKQIDDDQYVHEKPAIAY